MLPANDPFIEVLEQASAMTSGAGATGGTLIDVFPMRQSITPLTHPHTLTKRLYFLFQYATCRLGCLCGSRASLSSDIAFERGN